MKKLLTAVTILALSITTQALAAFPKGNSSFSTRPLTFKSKVIHLFVSEFYKTQAIDENYPYEPKAIRSDAVKTAKKLFDQKRTKIVKRALIK